MHAFRNILADQFKRFQEATMSTTLRFSIIGDSNVKRHLNPTNCRDRPLMSGCQLLPCGTAALLSESLQGVRPDSNVVLVSCLTNFLTGSAEAGASVSFRIEPTLRDAHQVISAFAVERPDLSCLVCPPMYRHVPLWYRDGLPEVMTKFSEVFRERPRNVFLMPSFPTPEFEGDGVHLTAYSGLEFVLHLFDAATSVLSSMTLEDTEFSSQVVEATRVLEDRMMSLEQDHRRLNKSVENRCAVDAENDDYQENIRNESWFVIKGLSRLPEGLSTKEWQDLAVRDVEGVLSILLEGEKEKRKIVVVLNKTGRGKDAKTRYHVQMAKLEDSKFIRNKFGSFFLGGGGADKRPPSLKPVSIDNLVTPATSVRISIMKVLGARYLASNPGSRVKVIGYESRPLLKLTPPASASDRRVKTYQFVEAIKVLPTNFTSEELAVIAKSISENLFGQLRSLFVVISDDVIKKRKPKSSSAPGTSSGSKARSSGTPGASVPTSGGEVSTSPPLVTGRNNKRGSSSPAGSGRSEKQKK